MRPCRRSRARACSRSACRCRPCGSAPCRAQGQTSSKPAAKGLPPLFTVMPHQPPSLPTLTATSIDCPAAGATLGTVQDLAAPARSAAYMRTVGPAGCWAHDCNNSAASARIRMHTCRLVNRLHSLWAGDRLMQGNRGAHKTPDPWPGQAGRPPAPPLSRRRSPTRPRGLPDAAARNVGRYGVTPPPVASRSAAVLPRRRVSWQYRPGISAERRVFHRPRAAPAPSCRGI